jgi:hypothetical protein
MMEGGKDVIYVHDASESAGLLSPNSLIRVSMIYYEETLGVCNTGEAVESHSTAELSESQVICSTILPLPLAAQKRRKSVTVAWSGASTLFARTRSRTAVSSGTSPFWRVSFFIAM